MYRNQEVATQAVIKQRAEQLQRFDLHAVSSEHWLLAPGRFQSGDDQARQARDAQGSLSLSSDVFQR